VQASIKRGDESCPIVRWPRSCYFLPNHRTIGAQFSVRVVKPLSLQISGRRPVGAIVRRKSYAKEGGRSDEVLRKDNAGLKLLF